MCGRFALTRSPEELTRVFGLAECQEVAPRANIAPATDIAVVRRTPTGDPVLHLLCWGLVPHWRQDPTAGPRPINARSETVPTQAAFRDAFQKRRCLIPADGFYEWQAQGRAKQPFFFSDPQGQVLALAGLWEWWRASDGGLLRTCCILTTAANAQVAPVHERMPLILGPQSWGTWLGGPVAAAQGLLVPAPEEALRGWPVSHRVNLVAEEGADLMTPVAAG